MDQSAKEGGLFRRNYVREPTLVPDSKRARRRIYTVFDDDNSFSRHTFITAVQRKLGISYPAGYDNYLHEKFWMSSDIEDVLSSFTIWVQLSQRQHSVIREAREIFAEEQLRYRIDDKGGVHYAVDEEFERAVQTTIEGLGRPQFVGARNAFEGAMGNLSVSNQSGKGLMRGMFEAVESVFLTLIKQEKVDRIGPDAIDKHLWPLLVARYADRSDADEIVERALAVLKAWVKAGHYYRHGTALEQIHEPPLPIAIAFATEGMGILRLLVSEDA